MFGIGSTELVIIIAFALLIFGPDKLPQMARTIGKFSKEFKRAQDSMQAQIKAEMGKFEGTLDLEGAMDPDEKKESAPASQADVDWDEEEEEEE